MFPAEVTPWQDRTKKKNNNFSTKFFVHRNRIPGRMIIFTRVLLRLPDSINRFLWSAFVWPRQIREDEWINTNSRFYRWHIKITININPHSNPFQTKTTTTAPRFRTSHDHRLPSSRISYFPVSFDILRHIIKTYSSEESVVRVSECVYSTRWRARTHDAIVDELFIWRFIAYDFDGSATLCDGFIAPDFYSYIFLLILYVLLIDVLVAISFVVCAACASRRFVDQPKIRARKWFNVFYLRTMRPHDRRPHVKRRTTTHSIFIAKI